MRLNDMKGSVSAGKQAVSILSRHWLQHSDAQ